MEYAKQLEQNRPQSPSKKGKQIDFGEDITPKKAMPGQKKTEGRKVFDS